MAAPPREFYWHVEKSLLHASVAFSRSKSHPTKGRQLAAGMIATLAAATFAAEAPGKEAMTPVTISDHAWSSTVLGTGIKTNDQYTEGNIFLTVPIWSTIGRNGTLGGSYLFVEPYTSVGTEGEVASSLGLAYRHLFSREPHSALKNTGRADLFEEGWFVGGSLFVDMLSTQRDNKFWQLGVGAEIGVRYLELRGNYYIPLSDKKLAERAESAQTFTSSSTVYQQSGTGFGAPTASGNQIVQDVNLTTSAITTTRTTTVKTVTEIFEEGMEGWDAEISALLPWVDQWMDVRVIGGYFSFDNQPFGPQEFGTGNVHGWKLGAEVRPVPAVVLSAYWYEDKRFTGADWTVGLQFQVPLDRTWKDAFKMRRRHLVERLAEPVHRQNDAIKVGNTKEESSASSTRVVRVTRIVSQTQERLVLADDVIFVNNGGPVGNGIQAGDDPTGTGTAEKPKATIQAGADIAAINNTTTGRVWSVYTQHNPVKPYTEDVAITQSTNFISSATPLIGKGGKNFGTGLMPVLEGSFLTCGCSPLGFVGITGYEIQASSFAAIDLVNVQNLKIASNKISNAVGTGIIVEMTGGNAGLAEITGNVITQSGSGMDGLSVFVAGVDSYLNAIVTGNTITGSDASGVGFYVLDESFADLILVGNNLIGNTASGLSVTMDFADLSASFAGNRFDVNGAHGVDIFLDNESFFDFGSAGDTFIANGIDGLHIESHNDSELFASVVLNGLFQQNGATALEALTSTDAFLDLSVVNSVIRSTTGTAVHGLVGDGPGGFPNFSLFFFGSSIDVSGADAVGIKIESPLTGIAALGLQNTTVFADAPVNAMGVQLLGSGVSCGCSPTIFAQIDSSAITASNFNSRGVDIVASNESAVVADITRSTISAEEVGILVFARDTALAGLGVTDGSVVVSENRGILVDAIGSSYVSLGITDSFIGVSGNSTSFGVNAIGLTEAVGATIEAFVVGNTISLSSDLPGPITSDAVYFEKSGQASAAIFDNNTIISEGRSIRIRRQDGADFAVSLQGNTLLAKDHAMILTNPAALGVFQATIQSNSIAPISPAIPSTGINLQGIDVNPGVITLENNSVSGFIFSASSDPAVTGTIRLNGVDITLPATVP